MTASGSDDRRVPNERRRTAARRRRDRSVAYHRVDDGRATAGASEDRRTARGDAVGEPTTSRRGVLAAGAALAGATAGRASAGGEPTGRTDRGPDRSDGGAVAAQGTRPVNREGWFVSDVTVETQRTYAGASAAVYNEVGRGRRAVTLSVTIYDAEGDEVRSGTVTAVLEDGEQRRLSQWWRPNPSEIEAVETADVLVVQER